jgi:hypothetical protein
MKIYKESKENIKDFIIKFNRLGLYTFKCSFVFFWVSFVTVFFNVLIFFALFGLSMILLNLCVISIINQRYWSIILRLIKTKK